MFGGAVANVVNAALEPVISRTETFQNETGMGINPARAALVSLITVFIVLSILLFFGKYLWNNVLVALVPGVRPAKSVWQILGLALLISLIHPGSCSC